jgi:alpha-tubulin suppressor-like RCC1 family protein
MSAVDTGLQHCVALSAEGHEVHTWGKAATGQLGLHTQGQIFIDTPKQVKNLKGLVVAVSAGFNHSAALNSAGTVFVWGKGMGLDCTVNQHTKIPIYGNQLIPREIDMPKGRKVVDICSR